MSIIKNNITMIFQNVYRLLILTILLHISVIIYADNSQAMTAMKQDYPGLMQLYGDRISSQKAHYIFVVDVSSSMLPYETVVKNNFLQFMNAVPDGDQVSLIKMSDESHTGFVGLLKCTPLDNNTRTSIKEVVKGFRFNKNGSSEDGSDGYTMAKNVIDAINVVGSNDLTFIYMLTDFEYWTHKNKYDKNKENWNSLASHLPETKMNGMCKYGIELNSGAKLRQEAIFKDELDKIFGKVEYQSVGSVSLLSNWFSHIATNVMSIKLNSLLKEDWKKVEESINSSISISGKEVIFILDARNTPLVNRATVELKTDNGYFTPMESDGSFPGNFTVGKFVQPASEKSFFPGFRQMGGDNYEAKINLMSPYAEEIGRLQGVCGEVAGQGNTVNLSRIESGKLPSASVWNSILPLWLWGLIILVIIAIIASFIYEYFIMNLNRKWMVFVKSSNPDGTTNRYNLDEVVPPITIGAGEVDLPIKEAQWDIKVFAERHNPALYFLKSGYYMILEQGDFAEIQTDNDYDPRTVSVGEKVLLYKAGKSGSVTVKIGEKGKTRFLIELN